MDSTALRAEKLKVNGSSLVPHETEQRRIGTENRGMIFKNGEHECFYYEMLKHMKFQDCYHRALVYVLGISGDTRRNFKRIYDVESGCVRTECLQEGWQTSGSRRIIRMAFNETDINPPAELGRLADASGDKRSARRKTPVV